MLKESHFFACNNRKILITSNSNEPILSFSNLNHEGKIILLFANHDYDRNTQFNKTESAIVQCSSWASFLCFFKRLNLPMDYIVLDRVDTWDNLRSKKERGRVRAGVLSQLTDRKLKGTCIIITTMGEDVGLSEQVDETISI